VSRSGEPPESQEPWRRAWRAAAAVLAPDELEALRAALLVDDPRLIQGATTEPPPLLACQSWPVEAACPLAYCGWRVGLVTVAEVEEFFARACFKIDEALGEWAACRYLLNWIDETPRGDMVAALLAEISATPAASAPARKDSDADAATPPSPDHAGRTGNAETSP